MKENWETNWRDYYQILQVHPSAEPEVINVAYKKLADLYHPDHNPGRVKWATEKFAEINNAYEILNNIDKRKRYDFEYFRRMGDYINPPKPTTPPSPPLKPKPEVNPSILTFHDLVPGESRRETFILKNSGGPYSKVLLSNSKSLWMNIVRQKQLSDTGKLPLLVEVEVIGTDWGKFYTDNIIIKLDDVETKVSVEVNTKIKIEPSPPPPTVVPKPRRPPRQRNTHTKSLPGNWALVFVGLLGIPVGLIYGLIRWLTVIPKHHLIYFSPALMSFLVLCIAVAENGKEEQRRGEEIALWSIQFCSVLAIPLIPEVRWFSIPLACIIALVLLVRYTGRMKKEHRETILLVAVISLILGITFLLVHPSW